MGTGVGGEVGDERGQRTHQAELFEFTGSQLSGHLSNLVKTGPGSVLNQAQLFRLIKVMEQVDLERPTSACSRPGMVRCSAWWCAARPPDSGWPIR
jgi:hypothetical protein